MTEEQKQQVEEIGRKFDLKLVLLYGSYAKGTHTAMSDLDIACMGNKPLDFETHIELYGELAKVFRVGNAQGLNVRVLDKQDPLLTYHVAKDTELLYGDSLDYHEFRAYAFRFYHDSKSFIELRKKLALRKQGRESEAWDRLSDEALLSFEESLCKNEARTV